MKVNIEPQYIMNAPGHAGFIGLHHQLLDGLLRDNFDIRVWLDERLISRPALSVADIRDHGDGRSLTTPEFLWVSLPKHFENARWDSFKNLIADLPLSKQPTSQWVDPSQSTPLYIVGPQRTGSTALLWALDRGTRYKAPKMFLNCKATLEGYHLRLALGHLLNIAMLSPYGDNAQTNGSYSTSTLVQGGFSVIWLRIIAQAIEQFYASMSSAPGLWIDKAPGWQSVPIVPLFHAVFPLGKSIFLTREPIACSLSMMRLDGVLPAHVGTAETITPLCFAAAAWIVSHFIWRHCVEPHVPDQMRMKISLSQLKGETPETVQRIAHHLNLAEHEQAGLLTNLSAAPTPSHKTKKVDRDPRIEAIIAHLTRVEARAWGYPVADDTTSTFDRPTRNKLLPAAEAECRRDIDFMLADLGIMRPYTTEITSYLIPYSHESDMPKSDHIGFKPGTMLRLLLEDAAQYASRVDAGEIPESMIHTVSLGSPSDTPTCADNQTSYHTINNNTCKTPLDEPTCHVDPISHQSSTPQNPHDRWHALQNYAGHWCENTTNQIIRFKGTFVQQAESDTQYHWSARLINRSGRKCTFNCKFNNHKGIAEVTLFHGSFVGVLRMDNRADIIDGVLDNHDIQFVRSFKPDLIRQSIRKSEDHICNDDVLHCEDLPECKTHFTKPQSKQCPQGT